MPRDDLSPLVKRLQLNASAETAFHHYTANIHRWWPLATHSLGLADARSVTFEARDGGRIYETDAAGREREWGRVLACEPPNRVVFSWVLEAPDKATEVEVEFKDLGEHRCELVLTHRGWDYRPDGGEWRRNYDTGWDGVLGGFAETLS